LDSGQGDSPARFLKVVFGEFLATRKSLRFSRDTVLQKFSDILENCHTPNGGFDYSQHFKVRPLIVLVSQLSRN